MNFKVPVLVLATILFASCGKKDAVVAVAVPPSKPSASSPVSSATVEISSAVNTLSNLSPSAPSFSSFQAIMAGGTWWEDKDVAKLCDERSEGCSVSVSGRDYVTIQLNPNAARTNGSYINVFGRMKSGLGVICAVGEAMGASKFTGNYLNDGTHKVVLTEAIEKRIGTVCGMNGGDEGGETGPTTLTVTVTPNSNKTLYEKTLSVCFGDVEVCNVGTGKLEETFMYKIEGAITNIASFSPSHNSGNEHYFSRLLIKMNSTAKTVAAEYLSATKDDKPANKSRSVEVLRLLKKGDQGIILSSFNRGDSGDQVYMIQGNIDDQNSDVSLRLATNPLSPATPTEVEGTFNRKTRAFDDGAIFDTSVDFGTIADLQTALYPNYSSVNYAKLSEIDAPNFAEISEVGTTSLLGTP